MKKSLIALAVLAASGAAMAQSSVTVYGVADIVLHKDKGTPTTLTSGGVSTSRLGFKGTEDLGGGLKANFKLEQKIDLTNGAGGTFDRESWVGLSGGFGEVQMGNTYTAYDNVAGASDPALDANVIDPTAILATRGYNSNPTRNITYISPSFNGLQGQVSYSLGTTGENIASYALSYSAGALSLNLAHQDETDVLLGDKFTTLNGSYDFGSFKLMAGYGSTNTANDTDYFIGVDVPVASNIVLSAGYAVTEPDAAPKETAFGLAGAYVLSKRTVVYAGYRQLNNAASLGGEPKTRYGVGIKHTF